MSDPLQPADLSVSGPIDFYVDELGSIETPTEAIALCTVRYAEAGPLLRPLIERAAEGALASEREARQLVRALYIAGGRRDPLVFEPLLRLVRRPEDEVEELLGDVVTEALPRIVAGVFDGNTGALFEAIADREAGEYVRDALMGAAAFLTFDKRIELQQMAGFLGRFWTDRLALDGDFVWSGWVGAIALLGLRILEPAVMAAFDQEVILEEVYDRKSFADDLATAERDPGDASRFKKMSLGYIDDVLAAAGDLSFGSGQDPFSIDDDPLDDESLPLERTPADFLPTDQGPAINPWRHVGRNDPCPCGSGKKAKRCCLKA
ncbi:DUF1186 domain-containing protein [Enhydrobacter sp.]|jgi:hypothetical protein|uniref:DUF1186 domain-containing protein n=1 Tax=Enhydrobacter sp. TaxID=1894999 RepID=UPI002615FDB1|nr:DUF1186 domain-containing protein [Enhydrobacter sp.]WIM10844.1 MAG: hypothetical protein OJF58_001800 [Enhydrobacter sp.]